VVENIIRLGGSPTKLPTIGQQLRKRETLPAPLKFLSSPALTGGLIAGLGLLTGTLGILPALGVFGGLPTVAGIIKRSPKAEILLKEKLLQPEKFGERIGEFIEDPLKPLEKPKKKVKGIIERIKEKPIVPILGTAGLIAGATALLPVVREKLKKAPGLEQIAVTPPISTQPFVPLAPVQKPVEEKALVVEPVIKQRPISIKNTFKPSIDISFSKTKKFINQQVLLQ